MESSSSDTESENYESATESLDDEKEYEKNKKSDVKSLRESEKERESFISNVDSCDNVFQNEENVSTTSLMYRKRPERVKRLSSKSPTRPGSISRKSSGKDSIFKHEISPDIFLQDITSNLTKNINRSLDTLHKKSSNVKDLILNSLPAGSVDEKEMKFSYDDMSVSTIMGDGKDKNEEILKVEYILSANQEKEEVDEKKTVPYKFDAEVGNLESKQEENMNKILPPENIHATLAESNENKTDEREEHKKNSPSISQSGCHLPEENLLDPKSEIFNVCDCIQGKKEKECKAVDCVIDKVSQTETICKESGKTESKECTENPQFSELEEKPQVINNSSSTSSHKSVDKDKNSNLAEEQIHEEYNEISKSFPKDKIPQPSSDFKCGEISNLTDSSLNKNTESLNKIDHNLNSSVKESDKECNLEELKTILKNMVPEETIVSQEKKGDLKEEKSLEMQNNSLQKDPEVNQVFNEGWDDFDFSDNEIIQSDSEEAEQQCPEKQTFNKISNVEEKMNIVDIKENIDLDMKNDNLKTNMPSTVSNIIVKTENKESEETIVHDTEVDAQEKLVKTETASNDDWDWDCWDESATGKESKEDELKEMRVKEPSLVKPSVSNKEYLEEKDFFDDNRWSGWETFGQKPEENQQNWGLGSWGVDMLLNKASAVTQGISNVLEAGLGAPDPETLARMEKMEREKNKEEKINDVSDKIPLDEIPKKTSLTDVTLFPVAGITNLVAGVTSKIVDHSKIQEIGSKVIAGGLDTLETFGKKTMEVLQEGDPGLRNKRALLLGSNKPVLSQVLREAREKADNQLKKVEEKELAKKCHFETLFDDFQGMVHLEALEMLSRQCELKIEQIKSSMTEEEQEDMDGILEEVEQLCFLDDLNIDSSSIIDFKISLNIAVEPLKDEISVLQILQIHEDVDKWLQTSSEIASSTTIHQKIVSTLAELTAACVHQFHKVGELLSVKECRKTVEEIDALSRMTSVICKEINQISERFSKLPQIKTERELMKKMGVIKENSRSYIRQAFNLLIPVVQIGAAA